MEKNALQPYVAIIKFPFTNNKIWLDMGNVILNI